jgi:hypothetical protein
VISYRLLVSSFAAAIVIAGCQSVCPSGTDQRSDPAGEECGTDQECRVRCACEDDSGEEHDVIVSDCQAGVCLGVHDLCEDGCGNMEWVSYCRAPDVD